MQESTKERFSVGKRIVKTALAAGISYFIASVAGLQMLSMAPIVALICMQPTIHETVSVSRNRILASIMGGLLAFLFFHIHPNNPIFMGLGVGIMLYICKVLSWRDVSVIAAFLFVSTYILLSQYPVLRAIADPFCGTSLGMVVSLVINYMIPPTYIQNNTLSELKSLFFKGFSMLNSTLNLTYRDEHDLTEFKQEKTQFFELFDLANKHLKAFKHEMHYMKVTMNTSAKALEDIVEGFSIASMYITQIAIDAKPENQTLNDDLRYAIFQIADIIKVFLEKKNDEELFRADIAEFFNEYDAAAEAFHKLAQEQQEGYTYEENARIGNLASMIHQISVEMKPAMMLYKPAKLKKGKAPIDTKISESENPTA